MNETVERLIADAAIARWLGFSAEPTESGLVYALSFDEKHIGNPAIRALHGGVIAAFLEVAAQCELATALGEAAAVKTINADIDYLSSSSAQNMFGRAAITRLGRRIAFIEATGWQKDETRPVANGRFRLRIGDRKAD